VLFNELFPIVTRLKWSAWTATLAKHDLLLSFGDIPIGLQYGFLTGLERYIITQTFTPPNHYKTDEHHKFVSDKYAEEIALGRISRGYPPNLLQQYIGPFRTAPLNVVQNTPGGKIRVTIDHSFPHSRIPLELEPSGSLNGRDAIYLKFDPATTSVNTVIDSKKFQCTWGTFSQCYLMVADAPPGTQAAIFDVDAAFRNIPTHPSARPFLACMIGQEVHLDNCLNFGASPCPGIWGRVADAMVEIYLREGVEALIKWVDDFVFFRYPRDTGKEGVYNYSYTEDKIWKIAESLGWPWAPKKFVPFASVFTYIGFRWDLGKLATWTESFRPTLTEVESLIGTLYKLRASFNQSRNRWVRHGVPRQVQEDLEWWRHKFAEDHVGMEVIKPPPPSSDRIYVDASTSWGIGLRYNDRWLAWKLRHGWQTEGRNIGWAEMVAVELALRTLIAQGIKGQHFIIHSDNQGVVGSLRSGISRGTTQNAILRKIVGLMQENKIWLTTEWVSTHENPADDLSRGVLDQARKAVARRPAIPQHLAGLIEAIP